MKRLERLLSQIDKTIAEEETDFEFAEFKTETSSLLKLLEESTTYLIDHSTEDSQPDDLMSTFTGIEDKSDDIVHEYRRLLKRNIATDATSAAIGSAQSDNRSASFLQTASSNQISLIEFSGK